MLKFIQVSKQYLDDKPALENVSFEIDKGELVLITGPSGSGKTTLLKLLTKELEPSEGEIFFGDQDLGKLKRSKIPYHRRKIGAVFQDYKLLPELNVWENIALALSILGHPDNEIEEKVTDLLKLVGLADKAYLFPHQLSGGEAQRISIARALSTAPQIIFADEPTGNLDAENSLIVAKLLRKINELGTTVIVTTHDPVVIKYLSFAHKMTIDKGTLFDENAKKPAKKVEDVEKAEAKEDHDGDHKDRDDHVDDRDDDKEQKTEVKVNKSSDSKEPKVKKHWGFFGVFKHKEKSSQSEKSEKSDNHDPHDHDHHHDDHHDHIEVESEDLDEDEKNEHHQDKKDKKSKSDKPKVKKHEEKED